ncbi:MAG: hypothetical protein N3B13_11055 [Deltaproteobacteria bacterium]|nr:hypothetical protein [Deltaproteobacteria bacterium]
MKGVYLKTIIFLMLMASPLFAFEEMMAPADEPQDILLALAPQGMNPPPPAVDDEGRIERFHKFRLMKLAEMADEAGIDDKTVLKMSEIFKKYDKQRFELFSEGKRLRTELKRLMDDKNAKKDDISKVIDLFLENRTKIQNIKTEEIKEIRKLLTPEQQARMILYMIERTEKGMKNLKKFGPKNGMGPGPGPGGFMGGWMGDDE